MRRVQDPHPQIKTRLTGYRLLKYLHHKLVSDTVILLVGVVLPCYTLGVHLLYTVITGYHPNTRCVIGLSCLIVDLNIYSEHLMAALPFVLANKLECSVCFDEFTLDEEAKALPCRHHYHQGCIVPWLEMVSQAPYIYYVPLGVWLVVQEWAV